jgi:hypothetical protein
VFDISCTIPSTIARTIPSTIPRAIRCDIPRTCTIPSPSLVPMSTSCCKAYCDVLH